MSIPSKVWESDNAEYREESAERLRALFPQGSEVRTIVTHWPRSETPSATVAVLAVVDGEIRNVSHDVARVTGARYDSDHHGVRMVGGNLDLSNWLVHLLARALYVDSDGRTLEQRSI